MKKMKWNAWEMRWENCKNPRGQGTLRGGWCCKTANMVKSFSFSFLFFSFGYFTKAWEKMSHRCDVTD